MGYKRDTEEENACEDGTESDAEEKVERLLAIHTFLV